MALKRIIQRRFNHPFRGGRIGSEWVAALLRNAWPGWTGISGRNASEYAFGLFILKGPYNIMIHTTINV